MIYSERKSKGTIIEILHAYHDEKVSLNPGHTNSLTDALTESLLRFTS